MIYELGKIMLGENNPTRTATSLRLREDGPQPFLWDGCAWFILCLNRLDCGRVFLEILETLAGFRGKLRPWTFFR